MAKLLRQASNRLDIWRVFSDFVEMAAISIANSVAPDAERETRYMQIIGAYKPDESDLFPQMLGHVAMALECELGDVLGEVFMELELGNQNRGQFFTPYTICRAIAMLNDDIASRVKERGFVTVSDPAVGGAALLIAFAEEAQRQGVNYQQHVHATGQDVDIKAVHMAYIQLSLIGMPAIVIHGNTLTMEAQSIWCTPMHVMGLWDRRLRAPSHKAGMTFAAPSTAICSSNKEQLELFL
ncbi:MAG: SAM-dependent DNA methyltransferase [Alcaligenaceae bacterium]|nr:SAM-dependent DNA methyltransferase [Alcaligenaceae bacterium]